MAGTKGQSYAAITAGKQGETICKDFLKMNPVKKGLRDDKDEKKHRRATPCHYEALAEHRFVGNTYTVNELKPKLEPIQVVGIIMAHSSYKGEYIKAIQEDMEPFCLNKTGMVGIDDASVGVQTVEESFPKVMNLLFNDPTDKLRTIVTFRDEMVPEATLRNRSELIPALKTILTSILHKTKAHFFANESAGMEWKEALNVQFDEAVRSGVNPGMGSSLEHEIATGLNLNSSRLNRNAVASMSLTQYKVGKQTVALSKAVIADKLDKLEEVLVIRNLDMIANQDSYDDKLASVTSYFGPGGTCHIPNVKEFFALSIEKKVVYVRFLSKKAKFAAEKQIKNFKSLHPGLRFTVARPNLETFSSDIRMSREEIREKLYQLYTNTLRIKNLVQYIPTVEAFKRGIFLDEQHFWERGKLRTWVEFTDPTNTLAVLTYSFNSDPFVGFDWEDPIPNPRFRARHPGAEYNLASRGIHVLNEHTKRSK